MEGMVLIGYFRILECCFEAQYSLFTAERKEETITHTGGFDASWWQRLSRVEKSAYPKSEGSLFRSTHPCSAHHIGVISCRVNPFGAFRRNDDKMVFEFFCKVRLEEGNKKVQHIECRGWIDFQPDHSGMTSKGKDDPIAEMPIESYKHPLFIDSLPEDLSVIGSRLACF
jgi:hypothetical protein